MPHRLTPWILLVLGEAEALGFLCLPDSRTHLGGYLLVFLAGSLLSLFAARSLSASGTLFLLLCGGLFRATLIPREPDLSDDLYRYLWDGSVAAAGISPYAYPPASPRLAGIAPQLRPRVAHPDIRTVYPPAAQALFRIAAAAGPGRAGRVALKAMFGAADLAVVLLLARSGPRGGFAAALYAFHPLAITESAGQGHVDSVGVALLVAAALFLSSRRPVRAGAALALSVLTKYISLACAPLFLSRGRIRFAAGFLATGAAIWVAAWRPEGAPTGDLSQYATRWESNSVLYPAAVRLMKTTRLPARAKAEFLRLKERWNHPAWTQSIFPFFYAEFFARALLGILFMVLLAAIAWRARTLEGALLAALGALLVVSPTLHPWYLLWVLPFAARQREPAFLFLSFFVPISYALMYPVPYLPRAAVLGVEYVPFALLAVGSVSVALGRRSEKPR